MNYPLSIKKYQKISSKWLIRIEENPPYSSDLAMNDFWLFYGIIKFVESKVFEDIDTGNRSLRLFWRNFDMRKTYKETYILNYLLMY